MRHLPRFAVGTIQPGASRDPAVWALMAAVIARGESPVLFRSSCDFAAHDVSRPLLGRPSRHLDSWAMSRSDAISALTRGSSPSDTAVIEGEFDVTQPAEQPRTASSLDRLCQWLDLPRIAVVDVREAARRGVQRRPDR